MTDDAPLGLVPYTEEERARDAADRDAVVRLHPRGRKVLRTSQRYDLPASPQTRERDLRIMGESGR